MERYLSSPPPPDSPLSYNEDKIVSLFTQIYHILIALQYISSTDIIFPPEGPGRHHLNTALLQELGVDARVQSLLERLPYFRRHNCDVEVYPGSRGVSYLHDEQIRDTRDPHFRYTTATPIYLRPHDVALTMLTDYNGLTWILDTQANTIRTLEGLEELSRSGVELPEGYVEEVPDNGFHYRNWPGFYAPGVLEKYIQQLRSLDMFPKNRMIFQRLDPKERAAIVRSRLLHEYGWPAAFQAENWARDCERVWEEARVQEAQDPPVRPLELALQDVVRRIRESAGSAGPSEAGEHPWIPNLRQGYP